MTKLATIVAALTLLSAASASADGLRVVDGDTIDLNGMPIRIVEIDTPETFRSRCNNEYALGVRAKARLVELLDGTTMTYQATGTDRWGRVLAHVYADGVNVGSVLIKEGYALPYVRGPKAKAARLAAWCGKPNGEN